jgi:large subunit ribosomal protein L22e
MVRNTQVKSNQKQSTLKFVLNCSQPVDDSVIVTSDFSDFLKKRIKVEDKLGNLQDKVVVTHDAQRI